MTILNGIDVSGIGQGASFNWAAYRGKISFAFIKATEGLDFRDPDFARNWEDAHAEGIVRGAYHFLHAGLSGTDQAKYFLDYAKPGPGDLLALDLESAGLDGKNAIEVAACAVQFAEEVHSATGAWPWAYTEISLAYGGYCTGLGDCPAWLANPSHIPTPPPAGPWHVISCEQTGQRGVDTDTFYGDAAQLAKLAIPHPAAPKPPPAGISKAQAEAALATLTAYVAES